MTNYTNMPIEVANYFKQGRRKIKSVKPNTDFTLSITFDNEEVKIYDMKDNLKGDVFKPIRELSEFQRVYVDNRGVIAWDIDPTVDSDKVWNNKIDLCPDSCYIYSKETL